MIKKAALTVLASLALSAGADAQILTAFDVSGSGGTTQGPGTPTLVTDPRVTSTNLARNTVMFSTGNNSFNSNTWNITNTLNTGTNYIFFDVTAGSAAVVFSSLGYAINGSNTAPNTGEWAYTLDGGTNFTLGSTSGTGGIFTNANAQPTARALWDFTDFTLPAGSTVEFRFFEFGATSINGGTSAVGGTTRIANITAPGGTVYDLVVNGPMAAVEPLNPAPEPTAYAILLGTAGLMGLIVYRRNRTA